jgi:ABC-2 type transport system ATP-binding protein
MLIDARNISIRFIVGDIKNIGLKDYVIRKIRKTHDMYEFWALRGISFSLKKGDMCGIIGSNGAGKTTLMKVVSGIMRPNTGSMKVQGNIAALLELSSGFDGDLTVRENTYLRGAMLGYTRGYMNELYDSIIAYAELEEFQEYSFSKLSTGMKARLAFAISSLIEPDILILDEVLAVGDAAFKVKSERRMMEIINGGAITLLVSHATEQVRMLCNKVLWIEKGIQQAFGDTAEICDAYDEFTNKRIEKGSSKVIKA